MKELALCLDGDFPNKDINDFGPRLRLEKSLLYAKIRKKKFQISINFSDQTHILKDICYICNVNK